MALGLEDHGRFASNSERVANKDDLHEEIAAVFEGIPSAEAMERLEAPKIANARMRTVRDFLDHPQLAARGRWRDFESPVGPLRVLLPPATVDGAEPVMYPIPKVGEHTGQILAELGYDDAAVEVLRRSAAV